MTSGMEDRHATDPTSKRREPLFVSNHHHLWLSRSHPPTPHLSRSVATLRSPAAHPRPLGRRTPWMGGPAPMAVTHLDEAGYPLYIH